MNKDRFPLYIPSKGRHEIMMTSKALTKMKAWHYVVVEPQEVELYEQAIQDFGLTAKVLELDLDYKKQYELCDNHGLEKSTGSGPARNFIWDHAKSNGCDWHWIMDDNIRNFWRLNKNRRIRINSSKIFTIMEDFVLRYENIAMAGPQYFSFAPKRIKHNPFILNTRIYSCNLIRTDLSFRWRGRYNEDTILSLDMVKKGWCTVLFNAFLQEKMGTQKMKGGNTDEIYEGGSDDPSKLYSETGTTDKSLMMLQTHPDCCRVVTKFNRIHHHADFSKFKKNQLIKKQNIKLGNKVNNYGLEITPRKTD